MNFFKKIMATISFSYENWSFTQTFLYIFHKIEEKWFKPNFFSRKYVKYIYNMYKHVDDKGLEYLKIGDIKISSLTIYKDKATFAYVLPDTFLSYLYCNDSYEKDVFLRLDKFLTEGLYGYKDEKIDVTVKSNDIVIDVGAWVGDFSAYCAHKDATVYAFEPSSHSYGLLKKTAVLNENKIIPIKMGLGSEQTTLCFSSGNSGGNYIVGDVSIYSENSEIITITTLDKFVDESGIEKVDFLKADIEGYEREFLKGAKSTIQRFSPKIAICTYHLPDDPEVLEAIIKEYNPKYHFFHSRKKLFAQCI